MHERLEMLYAGDRPWLLAHARKLCKGLPGAEDAAGELVKATLRLYHEKHAREGQSAEQRRSLLAMTLGHLFIDECRRRKLQKEANSLPTARGE